MACSIFPFTFHLHSPGLAWPGQVLIYLCKFPVLPTWLHACRSWHIPPAACRHGKKKKLRSPKLQFCNKSLLFIQVTARCQGRGEMRRSLLSESLEEQLSRPPHAAMWKRLGGSMVIGRVVGGRLGLLEWKAGSPGAGCLCCAGWVRVTGSLSLVKWGRERYKGKELQSRNFLFFSSSPRLHMGCCVCS